MYVSDVMDPNIEGKYIILDVKVSQGQINKQNQGTDVRWWQC